MALGKWEDIDREAREWASAIGNAEARKDAENAARALLSQGISLPRLLKKKLPSTTGAEYRAPMFEGDDGILYFNERLERGYGKYKEKKMAYRSGAQDNTFLHELGHHIDALLEPKAYNAVEHQWEMKGADKELIEKELSRYALQNRAEFEAELISATLRGKTFSKKLLSYSRLNNPERMAGTAGRLLAFASGEELPTPLEDLDKGFERMMRTLHKESGGALRTDILKEPPVIGFISTHAGLINRAIDAAVREVGMDEISIRRLKESAFVFSGIKTFHELNEAFPSLFDGDGNPKPFERFLNDVQTVHKTYNVEYLRTEYNFAHASALMAARWKRFEQDGGRYLLQYRTIGDDRVRRTHRMLHNITLPVASPFWDKYFPPNGWNCRCTVVQVRKGKYPVSDEREAMNLGSQATAGKYQEMFMFNPGKRMACFPAYNAYTIRECNACGSRPDKMKLAKLPDNELCRACRIVQEMADAKDKKIRVAEAQRDLERWYKQNLPETTVGKFKAKRFVVTNGGKEVVVNKTFYKEVAAHYKDDVHYLERLELARKAHKWMKDAVLVRQEESRHHKDVDVYDVYEYVHEGVVYELKCKQNADGYFLYYMKRK